MQPDSIKNNLNRVKDCMLYGKSIMDYEKEELAAFIIHQMKQHIKMIEEKSGQFRKLLSL